MLHKYVVDCESIIRDANSTETYTVEVYCCRRRTC